MESTYSQPMDLFATWRGEIDAEPFAYEAYWMTISRQQHDDRDGRRSRTRLAGRGS